MKIGEIALSELRAYAESIDGTTLETRSRHRKFTFTVNQSGFCYTPLSSQKPRLQSNNYIQKVLNQYNQDRSLSPSHYTNITVNASYLLSIIDRYLNS